MSDVQYAYQCNDQGIYVGLAPRQPSPLEPGVWLIPGGCVLVPPPAIPDGQMAQWDEANQQWNLIDIPAPAQPELPGDGATGATGSTGATGGDVSGATGSGAPALPEPTPA